ncbi:MAG: hypothetical protein HWE25_03480 [Alphaproteobacteria bacterium]|nr:hypothetical protein [Alphaproteobacteria bacterium]
MKDDAKVPSWVTDGLWKPNALIALEVLRSNILLLCFAACYASIFWNGGTASFLHLLAALPLNWIQQKLSWSLNTDAEAIYRATVTSNRDHVYENVLERTRVRHPRRILLCLVLLAVVPPAMLLLYSMELPQLFVPYYFAYLVLIFSSFAFFTHGRPEATRQNPDIDPESFVQKFGTLAHSQPDYGVYRNIFLMMPLASILWFLVSSKDGASSGQMAGNYLCLFFVLRADQAIYNARVFWLSQSIRQNKDK